MVLKTVRVPPDMEPVFAHAEDLVSRFFRERHDLPSTGTIEVFGERYLLVRAASLSIEFFDRVRGLYGPEREAEADDFCRNLLYDLAHSIGRADARNFHAKMMLSDPVAKLSAGPIHFAHAGWAFVEIAPSSRPVPGPDFFLEYDHPYSFECDAFVRANRKTSFPVCVMNAGYSAGWCEESFGMALVATELTCRAQGDERCHFIMAPPERIEGHLERSAVERRPLAPIPDLFARKHTEDVLRRSFEAELERRAQAEAGVRNAQRLEAIGRLAGGIAHDFNNLMAVVIARANLLTNRLAANDPMRAEIEQIAEAGRRASALTAQLLAFSRAQVLAREPLVLDEVVSSTLDLLSPILRENVIVERSLSAGPAVVLFDRSQLEQVLVNLAVNARDAMPNGGRLCVSTRASDPSSEPQSFVELVVRDTGMGMDEATLGRIFDPYFTTKPGHGAGLGLSTAHGVMQQVGGSIAVESRLGVGSTFTLRFPLHAREPAQSDASQASSESLTPSGPLCVLVVEDNAHVREIIKLTLEDAGYEAMVCEDPRAAAALPDAELARVDVLLTDVIMPELDGPQLALALRKRRANLHVMFLSGYSPESKLEQKVPGSRFMTKPFRPNELVRALAAFATRS